MAIGQALDCLQFVARALRISGLAWRWVFLFVIPIGQISFTLRNVPSAHGFQRF